jgi:RNA polymerase sigma-70 factor, ECF subfamily
MTEPSSAHLMRRYALGDSEAFDELFRRHEGRAFRYFVRRTGSKERAQDLYQDLFLRLHRSRHRFDPSLPFEPWFYKLAHRVYLDDVRHAFGLRELAESDRDEASQEPDVERQALAAGEVGRLLRVLSAEQQRVLIASKLEGLGYREVARDLGKSVAAVKQEGARTLRKLRLMRASG